MAGKPWRQGLGAAGHITVSQEAKSREGWCLVCFLLSIQAEIPAHGMALPIYSIGLLPQLT